MMLLSQKKRSVLVVDDDKEVVRLMRAYLEKSGYKVQVAFNGETAMHIIRSEQPDLVLLDLMLPDRDGWDITRTLRSDPALANIPIIMLTARVTDADKVVGLEIGADDYVTKPYNPREVVARINARFRILDGSQFYIQNRIIKLAGLKLDAGRHEFYANDCLIQLTATEFEIMHLFMEKSGYVLTRTEILEKIRGGEYTGIDRSLDSHIRNLRKKIEKDSRNPQYIKTVYGVGYKLETNESQ